jgi:hypothetical protein
MSHRAKIEKMDGDGRRVIAYFGGVEDTVIVRVRDDQAQEDQREPDAALLTSTRRAIWTKGAVEDELRNPNYPALQTFFEDVLKALKHDASPND